MCSIVITRGDIPSLVVQSMICSSLPAQSTNIVSPAMCVCRFVGETRVRQARKGAASKIPLAARRPIDAGCRPIDRLAAS